MAKSVDDFLKLLTASGLLSDANVQERFAQVPPDQRPQDGEALARELVKQKLLTKFQAEQLHAGKGKSLVLGNYVILDKLGQGGMGMVLKAEHKRMKRLVALKVMSPAAVKSPEAVKRFHREVEAAAKLIHPNIVAAFDADEVKGTHFLVMEYVAGTDLSALVKKNGPLPAEQAIQCIVQAARGLEFAHEQGVIHRDIKPANLLIDAKGTVRILDMGLARIEGAVGGSSEGAGLTSTGTIMGTVDYMSPEQAMDTKHADARSDIYSLGCTLYYLLVGKVVYDGDTMMKKLMAHQNAPIPELRDGQTQTSSTLNPQLSTLNQAFRRMVAKKPEDRPQTMTQVIAELERCLSGGSPTVTLNASSLESGSGNELQNFLQQISGGEGTVATGAASPAAKGTAVVPSSADEATMISSGGEAETDPRTELTLATEQSGEPKGVSPRTVRSLTPAGSPRQRSPRQRKRTSVLLGSLAAALLLLGAVIFFVQTNRGTLRVEINDPQIEVAVKGSDIVVKDEGEEDIRLKPGEHTLHVKRGDLEFDTDAITLKKGETIAVKVELSGRRVRAMRGNTLLGHREMPRAATEANAAVGSAPADRTATSNTVSGSRPDVTGPKPPLAKAPFDAQQARAHQEAWAKHLGVSVEYTNSIGMKFVLIPPGEFTMGSTPEEIEEALQAVGDNKQFQEGIKSEGPRHKVVLTQPTYLGIHEVTQADYEKVMGKNPAHFARTGQGQATVAGMETSNFPVENVNWYEAIEFCAKLSEQEQLKPFYFRAGDTVTPLDGTGYRLPTEAEWEFGCRAGTTTKRWIGDQDEQLAQAGWFIANSGNRPHAVGELKANPFGLYDVHGNVWEWVQDGWEPTYYAQFQAKPAINPNSHFSASTQRVFRGGRSRGPASCSSASHRHADNPMFRSPDLGYRVLLTVDGVKAANSQLPSPAKAPLDAQQARAHQEAWAKHLGTKVETPNSVGATMILIPPGEFLMGSSPEQVAAAKKMAEDEQMFSGDYYWTRHREEMPQHGVTITRPFWMGRTEVTVGQFRRFVESSKYVTDAEKYGAGNTEKKALDEKVKDADKGLNWKSPGYPTSDETPVTQVSWNDACAYCNWLSEQEQRTPWYQSAGQGAWKIAAQADGYRLPSEAEWEYACRAGTTTQFSFGDEASRLGEYAWYMKNFTDKAQPVALKLPNPFGLYDLHGNAWEWCQDLFNREWYAKSSPRDPLATSSTDTDHMVRGGYWTYAAAYCRSAYRGSSPPSHRSKLHGFRIVRVIDVAATINAQPTTPVSQPAAAKSADRAAAEWVLSKRGTVTVQVPDAQGKTVNESASLPAGEVVVTGVSFPNEMRDIDTSIGKLAGLSQLTSLHLDHAIRVGDADAAILANFKSLRYLHFAVSGITEAGLGSLGQLPNLEVLFLDMKGQPITDKELQRLLALTRLKEFYLFTSNIDEPHYLPLLTLPNVVTLSIGGGQLTDRVIAELEKHPHITKVGLNQCAITSEGIRALAKLRYLINLQIASSPCANADLEHVARLENLGWLFLDDTPIDDDGLEHLTALKKLGYLSIHKTKVTAAGVAALQKALPKCVIAWDDPTHAKPQ